MSAVFLLDPADDGADRHDDRHGKGTRPAYQPAGRDP
jgi:hypothetical protein